MKLKFLNWINRTLTLCTWTNTEKLKRGASPDDDIYTYSIPDHRMNFGSWLLNSYWVWAYSLGPANWSAWNFFFSFFFSFFFFRYSSVFGAFPFFPQHFRFRLFKMREIRGFAFLAAEWGVALKFLIFFWVTLIRFDFYWLNFSEDQRHQCQISQTNLRLI